ncbi:RNA helicase Mov10l1-like isoform X2 [Palaemon carinicauda]|uniref:RNA helicase Mov10l1-like isoform X2 n=1 Tax=Palaemon carinicauda TaxID=392227 RepID=UPI0035B64454
MFTFMQKAVGYISGSVGDSELHGSNYERPKLEDFISVSCCESKEFEGKITTISERDIVVDNDIYFSVPMSESNCRFKVGDIVQGSAERQSKYEAWRAVKLSLCSRAEIWEDSNDLKLKGETIPSRDLDAGIPGILKNDLFPSSGYKQILQEKLPLQPIQPSRADINIQKTVMGKVKCVLGDTVTLNEDISFNLSRAKLMFIIEKGDWILCKLNAGHPGNLQPEADPHGLLKVTHIEPLRKKKIKGQVTRVNAKHLIINNEVFCSRDLAKDIQPELRVGDAVVTEVIESDQYPFGWRSISLSPDVFPELKVMKMGVSSRLCGINGKATAELFNDKNNIVISSSVRFPQVHLGCKSYVTVFIKNIGEEASSLQHINFIHSSQDTQFSVVSESLNEIDSFTPIKIMPHRSCSVKIACTGKYLGHCKQVCIFDFGTFKIGRYMIATVEDKVMDCIGPTAPYHPREKQKLNSHYPSDSRVVKGEKPFNAPAFLPKLLPQYRIPRELWTAISNEEKAHDVAPVLKEAVSLENYQDRFSLLLFLEEIEMILQMRKFDIERTTFSHHGEYLSLTVPGLAEKRPSLMIGDSVIASNPTGVGGPEYEGFIHDVLHTKVLLKFHPVFHEQCQDKDYSVRFSFNRTPLRRCHYALKFCQEQLGSEVLFPKKLKYQLPQVVYLDNEILQHNVTKNSGEMPHQGRLCCNNGVKSSIVSSSVHLSVSKISPAEQKDKLRKNKICDVTDDSAGKKKEIPGNGYPKLGNGIDVTAPQYASGDMKNGSSDYGQAGKTEGSPGSLKWTGKRGSSVTPPRIPVVTRLFGVPSSGSSANSSICCSDEESRTNTDLERDSKFRKKLFKRSDGNGIENISKSESKSTSDENSTSDIDINGSPLSGLKRKESNDQSSKADNLEKGKKEFQLVNCVSALKSKTSGANSADKVCESSCIENLNYKAQDDSLDGKPMSNNFGRQDFTGISKQIGNNNGGSKGNPLTVINFQELLKDTNAKKYDYCIPVLPVKPSISEKVKSGKVPVLEWFNKKLNAEQKMAVRRILEGSTRPLPYVIYGPPGTGKTITLVETALQTFTLINHSRILIVAPSNSAADLITERLLEFGVLTKADLVRLNAFQRNEDTVSKCIQPYCYNGDQLTIRVRQRVIVATATTAGGIYRLGLPNGHFTHVFVDEAGQLTEPECLVALGKEPWPEQQPYHKHVHHPRTVHRAATGKALHCFKCSVQRYFHKAIFCKQITATGKALHCFKCSVQRYFHKAIFCKQITATGKALHCFKCSVQRYFHKAIFCKQITATGKALHCFKCSVQRYFHKAIFCKQITATGKALHCFKCSVQRYFHKAIFCKQITATGKALHCFKCSVQRYFHKAIFCKQITLCTYTKHTS